MGQPARPFPARAARCADRHKEKIGREDDGSLSDRHDDLSA
jgi:hypothetical protein